MSKIIPAPLRPGDEIRVVAPARGLKLIGEDSFNQALERFRTWGLKVSFATHTTRENWDRFGSSSIEDRVSDLHEAFAAPEVKGIFTVIGGTNSNQLLPFLDYDLIRANPKVFCGFSDITALLNGIYAQTGLVTFSGPHFSSFGMRLGFDYTLAAAQNMLSGPRDLTVEPSSQWSDDLWFIDQDKREFIANEGYWLLQDGKATGTVIGGNLGTFDLLLGSPYRPAFPSDTILFVEDCATAGAADLGYFERQLQALLYQPDFSHVKGVVIGRFQKASEVNRDALAAIIASKPQLKNLPVLANVDFGHTTPMLTLPIGGHAELDGCRLRLSLA